MNSDQNINNIRARNMTYKWKASLPSHGKYSHSKNHISNEKYKHT